MNGPRTQEALHVGVTPWTPAHGEDPLRSLVRQARLAEELGFESFFLPESHLHAGARPAPLIALAAIAGATERIRVGTTSLLLPLRDPLLLAEEIAVLDRLSNGRLILGLGRGFRPATFEAFGLDPRRKRERFEQVLAGLLRSWGVEPRWEGAPPSNRPPVEVEPRPLQVPHPPLWIAAFGPKAIAQAARVGLPYFASPMESATALEANLRAYRELRDDAAVVPAMRTVFATESEREKDAVRAELQAERRAMARSRMRTLVEDDVDEVALVDRPERLFERLTTLRERLGLTHLIVRPPAATDSEDVERSLRLLAGRFAARLAEEVRER